MRIIYTALALRQLGEIFAHIAANNAEAARCVVDRIEDVVRLLGENPSIGRPIQRSK